MTLPYLIIGAGVIALIAGWIGYHIGRTFGAPAGP